MSSSSSLSSSSSCSLLLNTLSLQSQEAQTNKALVELNEKMKKDLPEVIKQLKISPEMFGLIAKSFMERDLKPEEIKENLKTMEGWGITFPSNISSAATRAFKQLENMRQRIISIVKKEDEAIIKIEKNLETIVNPDLKRAFQARLQKREKELEHLIITDSFKESVAKKNKKLEELISLFLKKQKEFYEKQNKTCLTCGLSELDLENGDRYTRMVSCLKCQKVFYCSVACRDANTEHEKTCGKIEKKQ